jgi:hypothetical protein
MLELADRIVLAAGAAAGIATSGGIARTIAFVRPGRARFAAGRTLHVNRGLPTGSRGSDIP